MNQLKSPTVGVGAVVFHNDSVLLIRRKTPPYQNQWCIPGGKIHLGESLAQAAEREIREETGVIIQASEPVYSFEVIERDDNEKIRYHYIIIDLIAEYISGDPVGKDDALEASWVDRQTFRKLHINETTRFMLNKHFQFP